MRMPYGSLTDATAGPVTRLTREMRKRLREIFEKLLCAFGQRHWWPGDSPLEIMVGAVLTQNTSWRNVEKAIDNMKGEGLLEMDALCLIREDRLAEVIRPAGFYQVKSKRLKALITDINDRYGASIERMQLGADRAASGSVAVGKGSGPRDGGQHTALCAQSSGLRGRRLYEAVPEESRSL